MAKKTQFEVEVPTIDITTSNDGMITEASNYHLTCDKVRRELYHLKGMLTFSIML